MRIYSVPYAINKDNAYLNEKERIYSVLYRKHYGTEEHVILAKPQFEGDIVLDSSVVIQLGDKCYTSGILLDIYEVYKYQRAFTGEYPKVYYASYNYPKEYSLDWIERRRLNGVTVYDPDVEDPTLAMNKYEDSAGYIYLQ